MSQALVPSNCEGQELNYLTFKWYRKSRPMAMGNWISSLQNDYQMRKLFIIKPSLQYYDPYYNNIVDLLFS